MFAEDQVQRQQAQIDQVVSDAAEIRYACRLCPLLLMCIGARQRFLTQAFTIIYAFQVAAASVLLYCALLPIPNAARCSASVPAVLVTALLQYHLATLFCYTDCELNQLLATV